MAVAPPPNPGSIRRVPMECGTEEIHRVLQEDGAVKIPRLLSRELINQLNDDIDAHVTSRGEAIQPNRLHLGNMINISPAFRDDILNNVDIHAVYGKVFPPQDGEYWMNQATVLDLAPGTEAQEIHRDNTGLYSVARSITPGSTELMVNTLVALTDFREDNGATRLIVGSHKWAADHDGPHNNPVTVEMRPGDAVVYSGWTMHGGGENRSQDHRRALNISLHLACLTPRECYVDTPRDIIEDLTPLAQRMIAWRSPAGGNTFGLWTLREKELGMELGLKSKKAAKDRL